LVVGILLGIVTFLLRAEDALHFGIVIEQREEDRNALNDGGAEFRLDTSPIILEPALDSFELSQLFRIGLGRVVNRARLRWDAPLP